MPPIRLIPAAGLLLLLAACNSVSPRATAVASPEPAAVVVVQTPAAAAVAANDNLNAVAWMQTSVEFRLIAGQTWRAALMQLDRAIKTPAWDALTREDRATPLAPTLPLAVIVDVDETVLDNSPYQARLVRDGKDFDKASWAGWVNEAAARPIPGAVEFARAAAARGVTVYYISNRAVELDRATVDNLRKVGFPVTDPSQFLGLGAVVDGCHSQGSDKACRRQLVGRSHRVLMQFGDQVGDLASIASNTPAGREQAVRPYLGWVGERWFLLPNPSYGSWETALYGDDLRLPEDHRRRQKLDVLRY